MTILERVAENLQSSQTPFLVVGGFALNFYGIVRQTADLDLVVSDAHAEQTVRSLASLGYSVWGRTAMLIRLRNPDSGCLDVDLLPVDAHTWTAMEAGSRETDAGSPGCRIPAPEHLVAMKLHAMKNNPGRFHRDAPDIVGLHQVAGVSWDKIEEAAVRHGNEEILAKLRTLAGR